MLTQTVTITQNSSPNIIIGRRSTYETQQVIFDISWLVQTYGEGTAELLIKRPKDASAYPVVATLDGNTLTWTVSDTDTQDKGHGECEIYWYVNGGLAKSCICGITILRDIGDTTETAPDPYETWVDELTRLGAETLTNAQAAEQSANNAAQSASEADNSAAAALESEENALDSENAAKASEQAAAASEQGAEQSATAARQSATEAAQSATNAHDDATDASASADRAEQAAASIEGDTERAEAAAQTAQGAATSAQGSASTASTKATEAAGSAATAEQAATTATQKAADASASATAADDSASSASASATAAGNAQTAAETAQGKAEDAQEAAETAAQSIEDSAAQIDENTADILNLKSAFTNSDLALIGRENLLNGISWIDNKYIKGDGTVGDNTSYHMTDKIYLPSSALYTVLLVSNGGYFRVCAYNENDSVNSLLINGSSVSEDKRTFTFTFPSTASYIRISVLKPGSAYAVIIGTSVDNELTTVKSTIYGLKKVGLNCATPMRFNTSNSTLTFPRYTYVFIDNVRYSFESADIVLDYSVTSGNSVAVVFENNALAVKTYSNAVVAQNPILFHFTKNALKNPSTNDIFYPYYVDGVLFNTNSFESILYVNGATGSDSNDGSSSNPFATIQKAINANPTMIYVARGSYNETITILNKTKLKIMPWSTPVFSTSVFDVPMIVVNKVDCRMSRQIEFIDVYANNPGSGGQAWYIDMVYDATFTHCWASNAEGGGFVTNNLYGKFIQCKAWDVGSSSYVNSDGFNLHGYGTTELIDCVAHDCYDDGISHHDGCVATIKGGEFWNCTHGGGIAPVNRYTEIDGAYCHDNAWGLQATQADVTLYDPYILVKNSVLKNNAQKDISIGEIPCKVLRCSFDTKDISAGAQYVEIS